jgi:hypothetical protein
VTIPDWIFTSPQDLREITIFRGFRGFEEMVTSPLGGYLINTHKCIFANSIAPGQRRLLEAYGGREEEIGTSSTPKTKPAVFE